MTRAIVVGGGLSGMSAAHTILQHGGNVILIDKSPFCGGNSTKATSGINAAGTSTQRALNIQDSPEVFFDDTKFSAAEGARDDLIHTLTFESGPAVEWLKEFGIDLSVIARLAAHSNPRTHRGKERFPGMAITYGLMEQYEEICAKKDGRATLINKAEVTDLIQNPDGEVVGVVFTKNGKTFKEYGPVVIATGGFGADFSDDSLLASIEKEWLKLEAWSTTSRASQQSGGTKIPAPELRSLPTTNGPHCTGDGIKLSLKAGAGTFDLHCVQIHPTGIVDPEEPDAKVKFLAAEALRGSGGVILDAEGNRFCDELGKRDYVTGRMWLQGKAPYRLCLNSKASDLISWHCEHYRGRGLMKKMTGKELAKEIGVPASKLEQTFNEYNKAAEKPGSDKWGKKFYEALPLDVNDNTWHVAVITPVIHYCMGGVAGNKDAEVIRDDGSAIPGLTVAGEALGGVHGTNRLGGSSLLDCVVYGRVAGRTAARYMLSKLGNSTSAAAGGSVAGINVQIKPDDKSVTVSWGDAPAAGAGASSSAAGLEDDGPAEVDPNSAFYEEGAPSGGAAKDTASAYTMDQVAEHKTADDCWVVLHGKVYNVTTFLDDHPGGKKAIMLYAGKDASAEFDMLHKPEIIDKYAADMQVGVVAGTAKL
ncbi:Fumarate reductase (FRDS) (FAD-dependent oxidoreductase) (NADH-dependent fumarate reductase) [Durusdinium trenchii]|uniref:Fumarate reductase (FRDS) (FAD-dependent oxidoreductase) (NADH-dependent fumarate reductase) n=1 Tax=Durusdinium trenchii TaxID=1381693 RepID=A0ABP0RN22_9DINO